MQKTVECPCCQNNGLKIELNNGERIVTTGRKLSDFPYKTLCAVCKRTVKYDIVKNISGE